MSYMYLCVHVHSKPHLQVSYLDVVSDNVSTKDLQVHKYMYTVSHVSGDFTAGIFFLKHEVAS